MESYKLSEYAYHNDEKNHVHSYIEESIVGLLNANKNKCILDIGCGNGWLADVLIKKG